MALDVSGKTSNVRVYISEAEQFTDITDMCS